MSQDSNDKSAANMTMAELEELSLSEIAEYVHYVSDKQKDLELYMQQDIQPQVERLMGSLIRRAYRQDKFTLLPAFFAKEKLNDRL